jgi:hypothetical protein
MAKKTPKLAEPVVIADIIEELPDAIIEEVIADTDALAEGFTGAIEAVALKAAPTAGGVYVTNKALLAEFKISREKGEMTKELAKMVMLICERYARRGSYASYTYNEDLQSFALMNLVKSWKSFNPEKSQNPFAYFTSCIHNSFLQYLNQERKHRNIRDALLIENGLDPSYTYSGSYQYNNGEKTEQPAHDEKTEQTTE